MFKTSTDRASLIRPLAWFVGLVMAGVLLVAVLMPLTAGAKICPDYICYWAAGSIVLEGGSPYDIQRQTTLQTQAGWNQKSDGLGIYPFLPFYYPPWFAWLCSLFVPLGFARAKVAWLVFNIELLLVTAYLLRDAVPRVARSIPLVAVPFFIFSWASVVIGQTTPLIFFLLAASWKLIDARRDRMAGLVLAWLTIKPQLTGVVLLAALLWSIRQGRWGIVQGFAAMLAALAVVSFALLPTWPLELLNAPRLTPPPTEHWPWIGTTWFLFLKGLTLPPWLLWTLYLVVALPFLLHVIAQATNRTAHYADVISLSLLAAYVVAPYGRHYDFPVLLIPTLVLMGCRLPERIGALILITLLVAPYLQYLALPWIKARMHFEGAFNPEVTFAWLPLLLTVLWLTSQRQMTTPSSPIIKPTAGPQG